MLTDETIDAGRVVDPEQPIAWRGLVADTVVRSSDGQQVGTLHEVLGSDQEDIFHGIVVRLEKPSRDVFVPADDVMLMTPSHLDVAYTMDQLRGLPEHTEQRQAVLGWVGMLRRGLGIDDRG